MVGFLRRQHAGRLVQDQHLGAAKQRLQDLDPLLEAHRKVVHHRIEIDLEGIFALELCDLGTRPRRARRERRTAFGAEQQVLQHRERLDQHEVLVDHADAGRDRVLGALDPAFPAGDADAAAIGLIEAVEDVHQGRFAGAILADDAVNRAGRDTQVDALVGVDRPEMLVDADQLDRRRPVVRRFLHPRRLGHAKTITRSSRVPPQARPR